MFTGIIVAYFALACLALAWLVFPQSREVVAVWWRARRVLPGLSGGWSWCWALAMTLVLVLVPLTVWWWGTQVPSARTLDAYDDAAATDHHRVFHARLLARGFDALGVGTCIVELEWIAGHQPEIELLERARIEDELGPRLRAQRVVVVARRTNLLVLRELLCTQGHATLIATTEDALSDRLLLRGIG